MVRGLSRRLGLERGASTSDLEAFDAQNRDRNYRREILVSGVLRVSMILLNFITIPLYIQFLGQERYGVWVTVISIGTWIAFLDVGIGNGMRNHVAEALSGGNRTRAREFVSTAYIVLSGIILAAVGIFILVVILFDFSFQSMFNTDLIPEHRLRWGVSLVVVVVLLNFALGLVNQVLSAVQQHRLTSLGLVITNLLIVLLLGYGILFPVDDRFGFVVLIFSVCTLVGTLTLTFLTFRRHPHLLPGYRSFRREHVGSITGLGLRFFIIQVAVVIIFSTDNFIITQLFGAEMVTPYAISHKFFYTFFGVAMLLIAPLWSAYTEAYEKGDMTWIGNKIKFLLRLFGGYCVVVILLSFLFPWIKDVWVGPEVVVDSWLVILMGGFAIVVCWNSIFSVFLNGIGKIHVQLLVSIAGAVLNIPLSIYLGRNLGMGSGGIILSTILCLLIGAVFTSIQTYLILNDRARGIWLK